MKKGMMPRLMFSIILAAVGIGLIAGCKKEVKSSENGSPAMSQESTMPSAEVYTAELSGESEVPPVNTFASGSLSVKLIGDSIQVSGQFMSLGGTFTGSHIHMGAKGENGSVVQPLNAEINDDSVSGSWSPSVNSFMLTQDQISKLRAGSLYVNIHSVANKNGEIRGQLKSNSMSNSKGE